MDFGTDPCSLTRIYELHEDTTCQIPETVTMDYDTTYYWQVTELRFEAGIGPVYTPGPIWSFMTRPIAGDPDLLWLGFDRNVLDSSGLNNHGTAYGGLTFVPGKVNSALYFGGDEYVTVDGVADDVTNNDITLSAWIKTTDTQSYWFACNGALSRGNANTILFGIDNGPACMYEDDGGIKARSTTIVNDDEWHLLTFTRAGSVGTTYVDAVAEGTATFTYTFRPDDRWSIGQEWDTATASNFLIGTVDDVRIYGFALSPEEVEIIMRGEPERASNPNPGNGSTPDIEHAVPLSWSPGEYAQKHDVYFGTDFDDVNNATTAVDPHGFYQGRQDPNQYPTSGTLDLEYGKTYYWRIDEVNAPPDLTMYKGQVWQFTVETFAYPIPGEKITATASSVHNEGMGPENTINGSGLDENDLHSTQDDAMWLSSSAGPQPTWIQYEFDRAYKLYEMWVWNFNQSFEPAVGFGLKEVTIEYSANGVNWTELGSVPEFAQGPGMDGYAHNTVVSFDGAVAKYVKITANSNWGGLAQYGLSEVRFFYVPVWAREPNPQNGATGVGVDNTTVSWRAGREAASHKVYFSTSREAVVDETISPVSIPADSSYARYDTGELDLGRTYYWKVNEVNDAETPTTWKGDIWSFAVLDYLVVDDMETYGSADIPGQPGSRIWYTWNDGYGWTTPAPGNHGNNTGAIVDANSATVHGDKQSLRIDYDNDGTFSNIYGEPKNPYHSEVKREWTTPQDWTRNGIKALTVWFYGAAANAAEQLYVALEDNAGHVKIVNYSDLEAVRVPVWQEWNIALSEFSAAGVNLKAVKKMYIGLGNRTGPTAGGTGTIYIDDIRLYPSRCIPELSKSAGDINNDCIVDFSDYAIMASDWLLNDYSIPAAPITKTPVAHWALDEGMGTTTSDSAGNHHGAIKGGVGTTWVAGKVGNYALHFNGEDNHYVDCGTFNPAQGTNEMTAPCGRSRMVPTATGKVWSARETRGL